MKSHYHMMILMLSLLPLGCAHLNHNHQEQALAHAKASFLSDNYRAAYKQLAPLAKAGNAEAQYALGYLYFYGKGQSKNAEKANYWITKSADQRYLPAIRALNLMQTERTLAHQDSEHALPIITRKVISSTPAIQKTQAKASIKTVQATRKITPVATTEITHPVSKTISPATPNPSFTVQLVASHDPDQVRQFVARHHFQDIAYFTSERNNQTWYIATLGQFDNVFAAKAAINNLPLDVQALRPWVRRMKTLIPSTTEEPTTVAKTRSQPFQKSSTLSNAAAISLANQNPAADGESEVLPAPEKLPTNAPHKAAPAAQVATTDKTVSVEDEHQTTQYHGWMRVV